MKFRCMMKAAVCLWTIFAGRVTVDSFSLTVVVVDNTRQTTSLQRPILYHAKESYTSDAATSSSFSELLSMEETIKVNDLLSDLPTPTLLIELSLAESAVNQSSYTSLDDFLLQAATLSSDELDVLDGTLFVHTKITGTSERDRINRELGSGKSLTIGTVDCIPEMIPGGAYLGIGLANHHVGGYYWARGMGIGASLPAHGVEFRENEAVNGNGDGELYWKKRGPGLDATETTEESSNSNDGKRSEWSDFLAVGDTVQLVPCSPSKVLLESPFQRLIGVRRLGRPLGADPIVEQIWKRQTDSESGAGTWVR